MDYYFDWGYSRLKDSMNERDFRMVLTYVIEKIRFDGMQYRKDIGHRALKRG